MNGHVEGLKMDCAVSGMTITEIQNKAAPANKKELTLATMQVSRGLPLTSARSAERCSSALIAFTDLHESPKGKRIKSFIAAILAIEKRKLMPNNLNELRDQCFADADNHGLWDDDYVFVQTQPTEIMKRYAGAELIEAETREMKQAVDYPSHYVEELADVIIMALSVAGYLKIDIDTAVRQKMFDNRLRKWRHGK